MVTPAQIQPLSAETMKIIKKKRMDGKSPPKPQNPVKAIGGGAQAKFCFYVVLVANLVYFHPLFTELKNFDPLAQNWPIGWGGWGLSGGHFEPF